MSAVVNGENVQNKKCRIELSKKLGFNTRRMSTGKRIRTNVLTTENSPWTYSFRKTRCDTLSEEIKKQVYEFWIEPENSRPTGNKTDLKRVRLGPKQYATHMKYVLEKTQTEVYLDFKEKFPNIKISQRLFEKLKPFFVIPVRPCDRETCCCRYHVEARFLFKSAMDFRKKNIPKNNMYPIYDHLTDLLNVTLCPKKNGENFHDLKCVERRCEDCGIKQFLLSEEETATDDKSHDVEWMRYEYITIKTKTTTKKKLCLVKKKTKPGKMFEYFTDILFKFSAHVFRSKWQSCQLKHLKDNLPENEIICIHDFSENYACKDKVEIQSSYFQKTEVSLHVSIIYRHPVKDIDDMTDDSDQGLIEEHFFVISPDQTHDHNYTHEVQKQICQYLKNIKYNLKTIHEFTDGCSSQYKSRHRFGDVSYSKDDFGCNIIRNFFETSHAKGVQDSAGGLIKNQADYAVARGKTTIQNAKDLFDFCNETLITPKQTSSSCKKRLFRYVEEIPRERGRLFKPVPSVRCIHQIKTVDSCNILVRNLSCYTCSQCADRCYNNCTSSAGPFQLYSLKPEQNIPDILNNTQVTKEGFDDLIQPGIILAVFTDYPGEDYYLVKCLSDVQTLDSPKNDDWGNCFQVGAKVVDCFYFDKTNASRFEYKLLKNKTTIIPVLSIRYICIGIETKYGKFSLSEDMHLDILEACGK